MLWLPASSCHQQLGHWLCKLSGSWSSPISISTICTDQTIENSNIYILYFLKIIQHLPFRVDDFGVRSMQVYTWSMHKYLRPMVNLGVWLLVHVLDTWFWHQSVDITMNWYVILYIDGLVQERRNSIPTKQGTFPLTFPEGYNQVSR